MIKLTDFLKEEYSGNEYILPPDHKPFMYSKVGFSCAVCAHYSYENGEHKCSSGEFQKWYGSEVMKIDDPTKWCSDWFEPMT